MLARTVKQPESNIGKIVSLNPESKYEFKIGDEVVFNLKQVRGRLNLNGIHVVVPKEAILAGIYR